MLKNNYIHVDISDSENNEEITLDDKIDLDYTKKMYELYNINLDLEMKLKNESEKYQNLIFISFVIGFTTGFIFSHTINN